MRGEFQVWKAKDGCENVMADILGTKRTSEEVIFINAKTCVRKYEVNQFAYAVKSQEVGIIDMEALDRLLEQVEKTKKPEVLDEYSEDISAKELSLKVSEVKDRIKNLISSYEEYSFAIQLVIIEQYRKMYIRKNNLVVRGVKHLYEMFIEMELSEGSCLKRYISGKLAELDVIELISKVSMNIEEMIEHSKLPVLNVQKGVTKCILNSKTTGILIHEIIGHLMESDNMVDRKYYELGEVINDNGVSVIDVATSLEGVTPPYQHIFDDVGNLARNVTLVKNGIIWDCLGDARIGRTGNFRVTKSGKLNVRMNNVVVLGHTNTPIITNMEGLSIRETGYAWVTKSGEFEIEVLEATIKMGGTKYKTPPLYIRGDAKAAFESMILLDNKKPRCDLTRCSKDGEDIIVGSGGVPSIVTVSIYEKSILYSLLG